MCESSSYETTYSEDERINNQLQQDKKTERKRLQLKEHQREIQFNILREKQNKIFDMPGLKLIKFTSKEIKLSITPSQIKKSRYGFWFITRDTLPLSKQKEKIYELFPHKHDINIVKVIIYVYQKMVSWTILEEKYRLQKFRKFVDNKIDWIELDSDDEELFFSQDEIREMHLKKHAILRRMLPPYERHNF